MYIIFTHSLGGNNYVSLNDFRNCVEPLIDSGTETFIFISIILSILTISH